MKWYKPRETLHEFQDQSKALAALVILAIGLSLAAIFIAIGKD